MSFNCLENLKHFLGLPYVLLTLSKITFLALLMDDIQERLGMFVLMQSRHLMLQMQGADLMRDEGMKL